MLKYNIEQIELAVLILALDTTTRAGSVALVRDGDVLVRARRRPALTHGAAAARAT